MTTFRFKAIRAKQADGHDVFSFAATPEQILAFSEIERVGRNDDGQLKGFQRHQVASHIREIRDYLSRVDAILPNAVIVAFIDGVKVKNLDQNIVDVEISTKQGKPGFIVDGQQRLTALSGLRKDGFQVFVSALICRDQNELKQQFVLINNTRPLPKTLIYELLPEVSGLPERLGSRKISARVIEKLNHNKNSALRGEIKQHTNPKGTLSDTAMQKIVMNSATDGALREFIASQEDYEAKIVDLLNEFFFSVKYAFGSEWVGMNSKSSRLRHGAGLVAMGFVMETIYSMLGATHRDQFIPILMDLRSHTAWTSGEWKLADGDVRKWNGIQNTPTDISALSNFLAKATKKICRKHQSSQFKRTSD